jgi:septal ring factor EnvC (AmiA/AmiB activator)
MTAIMSTTPITTTTIAAAPKTNCGFAKLELDRYISCKIWLEGYNSQATKKLYRIHLSLFCKYHNIDPDSLIQFKPELVVEYMKAVDALTINEEYRLKKKIVEYEDKLKDVPRIEQLESHLANKIVEQDAIKNQLERLQIDKQKETQTIQQKDEQIKKVNQQLNVMQSQMQALITTLGNMDETSKNLVAKKLFQSGMLEIEK